MIADHPRGDGNDDSESGFIAVAVAALLAVATAALGFIVADSESAALLAIAPMIFSVYPSHIDGVFVNRGVLLGQMPTRIQVIRFWIQARADVWSEISEIAKNAIAGGECYEQVVDEKIENGGDDCFFETDKADAGDHESGRIEKLSALFSKIDKLEKVGELGNVWGESISKELDDDELGGFATAAYEHLPNRYNSDGVQDIIIVVKDGKIISRSAIESGDETISLP